MLFAGSKPHSRLYFSHSIVIDQFLIVLDLKFSDLL